ncbi:MAG: PQQ-binding-like beta-propeller repeat protein [Fibromonadales bacterium]|nr:PQQ-binding-like beta-propeller repeat protein [Fibromonadales bacterium]
MLRGAAVVLLLCLSAIASPVNDRIQEAAYALSVDADTAKAERLFSQALELSEALVREKLKAHLYLAKIAEAKNDTLKALEHYAFLKNNSQSVSFAYMAADREKSLGASNEKIKMANEVRNWDAPLSQVKKDERFLECDMEGELYLAQHIVYKCPDNSLHLVSKKDGTRTWNIPFVDKPAKVFLTLDGLFLYCENALYFYSLGSGLDFPVRISTFDVLDVKDIGDKIYVLDISGNISLLNKNSGKIVATAKSDGEKFFKPGIGLIGTYQKSGGISVFDTLLNNLWDYQIDGEIDTAIASADSVIFYLQNGTAEILYTRHYQKLTARDNSPVDSLLAFESGNALAWYNIATQKDSDAAWKRAVIYGARKHEFSSIIFTDYASRIGAKWVKYLPVSSTISYPRMFGEGNWLFVYDDGSQSLLKFSLETGAAGSEIFLPKEKKYTLANDYPPWLILSSSYWLSLFSLKEQSSSSIEMPGVPFSYLRNRDSIYVGLLNGFVLKCIAPKMRLDWSRKVSSAQVFLSRGEMGVYSLSQGKATLLSSENAGNTFDLSLSGAVSDFKFKNGLFAVVSDGGKVQFFSEAELFKPLGAFSVSSQVISIELLEMDEKNYALVGETNQNLSLYEVPSGDRIWTFKSKGSAAMQPVLHGSRVWLDQDGSVVALDMKTGKIIKKHSIFGSGASISIQGNTLYCATPEKLLYAFPL